MSTKHRFYQAIPYLLAFVAIFTIASPASAATCQDEGGSCLSNSKCEEFKQKSPNLNIINKSTDDCKAEDSNTCCIIVKPKEQSCETYGYCAGNNGQCDDPDKEQNLGVMDCQGGSTCCRLKTVAPSSPAGQPGSAPGSASPEATAPSGIIPPQVRECIKDGDCTLDQIVQMGVGFANFLMGLSGALFLVIFIYGGAMYLLSFGNAKMVETGKSAIKGATIGIIIVLSAWTIVRTLVTTLKGSQQAATPSGAKPTCGEALPGGQCMKFTGSTSQQVLQNASAQNLQCMTGYCPGDFHTICCKAK